MVDGGDGGAGGGDAGRSVRWHAALAAAAAVGAVLAGVGITALDVWLEQQARPPTCFGIGWGCTPDAATTAVLIAFVIGVPTLVVATLVIMGGWLLARARPTAGRAVMWVPGLLVLAVDLLLVLEILRPL